MTCLIWRQHRWQALWTILTVTTVCGLILELGLGAQHWLTGYHAWLRELAAAGCPPPTAHSGDFHVRSAQTCLELKDRYPGGLQAAALLLDAEGSAARARTARASTSARRAPHRAVFIGDEPALHAVWAVLAGEAGHVGAVAAHGVDGAVGEEREFGSVG